MNPNNAQADLLHESPNFPEDEFLDLESVRAELRSPISRCGPKVTLCLEGLQHQEATYVPDNLPGLDRSLTPPPLRGP